jgi:hypothetical protein
MKSGFAKCAAALLLVTASVAPASAALVVNPGSYLWSRAQNYWWGHINAPQTPVVASMAGTANDIQCEAFGMTYCNTSSTNYNIAVGAGAVSGTLNFTGTQNRGFYDGYGLTEISMNITSTNGFNYSFGGNISVAGSSQGLVMAKLNDGSTDLYNGFAVGPSGMLSGALSGTAAAGTYTFYMLDRLTGGSMFSNSSATGTLSFLFTELESSVPAPGALALIGLGLAGLGALRRRAA